jgi:hypothetical protein
VVAVTKRRAPAARPVVGRGGRAPNPMARPRLPKVMEKLVPVHQRRTGEIAASVPGQMPSAMTTRLARRGALHPRLATMLARPARRPTGADKATARRRRAGLTPCDGGKSHRPKRATHRHQCKVSKDWGKERSSWSGRSGSVLACGFSGPCHQPRPAPEPDPGWRRGTSCCCVAVFCCCTRPWVYGLRISNLSV